MLCVDACLVTLRIWTCLVLLACTAIDLSASEVDPVAKPAAITEEAMNQRIDWDKEENALVSPKTQDVEQLDVVTAMTQMGLGLLFVIGLLISAAWAYRRWGRRLVQSQMGQRHMELIESMNVGVKRQVLLLRVQDQVLVIGQGEHELQTLSTMPYSQFKEQAEEVEEVESAEKDLIESQIEAEPENKVHNFKQKLAAVLQRK